ncbi:MAG: POT family MFS transporter [Planctomycetales bacterium]|nr:POT family MFS transporter [Planctomycetales bacterium]
MSESKYRTQPENTPGMPSGIPFIVGNEAAERFSYYGMKAILTVFMTKHLFDTAGHLDPMSAEDAKETLGWFGAAVYATPFLGAIIADRFWGKYLTILRLSLLYCAGHFVLAMMDTPLSSAVHSQYILITGLTLISLGAGGIKPCVTSHVGDQFGVANQGLLQRGMSWFYFSINFGSTISTLITPLLLVWCGPGWAFGVPGVLMAIATLVFWMGRYRFAHIPPAGKQFWTETISPLGLRARLNLTPVLLFVAIFWSLFDQSAGAWVLQADEMNRNLFTFEPTSLGSLGVSLFGEKPIEVSPTPSQFQVVNPILVMLMIPVFSYVVYPTLNRFFEVTPLRKIGIGMFVGAGSFAIAALAEERIQAGVTPHVTWQLAAYLVLTAAEIMVSITMLEFFYTQSPRRMKSLVMAFCMLSISVGNVFTALVNRFIEQDDGTVLLPGASYYWFFVGAMVLSATAFAVWSQFYRGETFIQGDEEAPEASAEGVE